MIKWQEESYFLPSGRAEYDNVVMDDRIYFIGGIDDKIALKLVKEAGYTNAIIVKPEDNTKTTNLFEKHLNFSMRQTESELNLFQNYH